MSRLPPTPILYLITSGQTGSATTSRTEDYQHVLRVVEAAVAAGIDLIQIREKNLFDRQLYSLTREAVTIAKAGNTRVLVNDRADIAVAAGAQGVHLTSRSLRPTVIRKTFGEEFLIGASTHSLDELERVKDEGADFAVFGPVFNPNSKEMYGPPVGLETLQEVVSAVAPFPVLALGGISLKNASECYRAGASGIAAIGLFDAPGEIKSVVRRLRTD